MGRTVHYFNILAHIIYNQKHLIFKAIQYNVKGGKKYWISEQKVLKCECWLNHLLLRCHSLSESLIPHSEMETDPNLLSAIPKSQKTDNLGFFQILL